MTFRAFAIIGGCAAAQLSVGACLSVPWWLPDLLMIGVLLATAESSRPQSRDVLLLGGVVAMAAAMPSQRWIGLAYPIAGGMAVGVADRLELRASTRLQVAVGMAEALLLILGHGPLGWSLLRLASTMVCVPAVRRLTAPPRTFPSSA